MQNAEAVTFTIPGKIGGKGRGRATIRAGHAVVYTPEKTRATEAMVRELGARAMAGRAPLDGPLRFEVLLLAPVPKSWPKKRQAAAKWITGKPDCDNVIKLAADALNGVVYGDDSQIAEISFQRRYAESARVEVTVTPLFDNHGAFA